MNPSYVMRQHLPIDAVYCGIFLCGNMIYDFSQLCLDDQIRVNMSNINLACIMRFEPMLQTSLSTTIKWLQKFLYNSTQQHLLKTLISSLILHLHAVLRHILQILLGQQCFLATASRLVIWLCHPPEKLSQSKH